MIRFSIIIPAYNAAATLPDCIRALLGQSVPSDRYEIIVVDDGSTDQTAAVAEELLGKVSLPHGCVLRAMHRGQAAARNDGLKVAQGELVLFTDADCEAEEDWIARLTAPFADAAISGAKGVYRTRQKSLVARFVQQEYEQKCRRMSKLRQIDFIDTYSAAYRRDLLVQSGGFRSELLIDEDQELSFRLAGQGLQMVLAPDAVVGHRHVASPGRYFLRKLRIGFWKAAVVRLHPGKSVGDSHTPFSLKVQIAGVFSAAMAALGVAIEPAMLGWALAVPAIYLLSMVPLLMQIGRRDARVLWIAPGMICLRSLALAIGFSAGFVRFILMRSLVPSRQT